MRRVVFITLVMLVGIGLGFAVAGMPRRGHDRPLSTRHAVTITTTDPQSAGASSTTTVTTPAPATTQPTVESTTTTAAP
jgi:hypothetical protein